MTPPASLKVFLYRTTLISSLAAASLLAAPSLASAADAPAPGADAAPVAATAPTGAAVDTAAGSDDVVVTARHQSERALDVPIALTALPRKKLEQTNAYTLADVQNLVPSLVAFQSNARNSSIGIRGIGVSSASDGLDTTVGVYVDGVYLGRPGMMLEDLIDLDQVEVLRGPQGTLFGRNSAAGVVNITTARPTFNPSATIEGSFGNYDYTQLKASLNGPLIDGLVAARLTAFDTHRDGVLPNTKTGTSDNSIGRSGARLQFLITPTPKLTLRLIGDYSIEDDTCCVSVLKSVLPASLSAGTATTLAAFAALGYTPVASTAFTQINSPQEMLTDQHSLSGEIDYDLGWGDFTSITAYRYWRFHPLQDSDGTPLDIIQIAVAQSKDDQYTQEFRLASKPGRFTWQLGAYFFDQDLRDHFILDQFGSDAQAFYTLVTGKAPNPVIKTGSQYNGDTHATEDSAAVFGQGNFKITDKLILTAGLRYTYDAKHGITNTSNVGTPYLTTSLPFHYNVGVNDTNLSYLASLSYKLTPNVLAYVSYSTGYQAAGLNLNSATSAGIPLVLNPENVTDWEGGIKAALFDHRVVVDLDVYSEYLTGLQANISPPGVRSYLANVGNVIAQGVEADLDWEPIDGLDLSANGSYNDTRYASYANPPSPSGIVLPPGFVPSLTGKPVYQAPKWIFNAIARYDWSWRDGINPYAQVQYSYRSSVFGDVQDSPGAIIPAYSLVNARLGARFGGPGGGRYDASVWVENAGNAVYFQTLGAASVVGGSAFGFSGELGPPRTYGVTLRASF
jgi:iron complex outermembrane receptor protein